MLFHCAVECPVAKHRVAAQVIGIGFEGDRHTVPVQPDRVVEAGAIVGIEACELRGQAIVRQADAEGRGIVRRVTAFLAADEARCILQEHMPVRASRIARTERGGVGEADFVDVITPLARSVHARVLHDVVESRFVFPVHHVLRGLALTVRARAHRNKLQPVFRIIIEYAGWSVPITCAQRVDEGLVRILVRIAPVLRDEMAHAQLHVVHMEDGRVGAVGHDLEDDLDSLLGGEGCHIEGVALPVIGGLPGVAQVVDVELRAAQLRIAFPKLDVQVVVRAGVGGFDVHPQADVNVLLAGQARRHRRHSLFLVHGRGISIVHPAKLQRIAVGAAARQGVTEDVGAVNRRRSVNRDGRRITDSPQRQPALELAVQSLAGRAAEVVDVVGDARRCRGRDDGIRNLDDPVRRRADVIRRRGVIGRDHDADARRGGGAAVDTALNPVVQRGPVVVAGRRIQRAPDPKADGPIDRQSVGIEVVKAVEIVDVVDAGQGAGGANDALRRRPGLRTAALLQPFRVDTRRYTRQQHRQQHERGQPSAGRREIAFRHFFCSCPRR